MKRFALTAVLLGLALIGSAHAQVATTDLVPAAPFFTHPQATGLNGANITPDNPAALAWGTPSRVAIGALKGKFEDNLTPPSPTVDFDGKFGGLRLVGETFGIAVEQLTVDEKNPPPGSPSNFDKSNDLQVSLALGKWLAFGIGAGKSKSEATGDDISRKEAGISLRLNEIFYLGVAAYQDENTPIGLVPSVSDKRNGTLYGIALRTEGNIKWYVAYDALALNSFDFTPFGGPLSGGFDLSRFSVQAHAGWFLVGASVTDIDVKNYGGGKPTVKHKAVDLGFAPMQGLTVTARVQVTDVSDPLPSDATITTNSLAVAWQF